MKTKKILLTVPVILLLFIPTYIAACLYFSALDAPVKENAVVSMDIGAPDGEVYSFSKDIPDELKIIELFLSINDSSKSVISLPDELEGTEHYTVTYYSYNLETVYSYYFSKTKPSSSYLVDNNGNTARISASLTIAFLDSGYSSALYKSASAAPLLTVGGDEMLPVKFDWHYFTYSAVPHTVSKQAGTGDIEKEMLYLSMPMSFSIPPDNTVLTLTDENGGTVYSGSLSSFTEGGYLTDIVHSDINLSARLEAVWNDSLSLGYGGSAVYSFVINCIYDPPAAFSLSKTSIEYGEFTVLTGINIESPDDIDFSSEPELGYSPVFCRDGDYVRALIPVSYISGAAAQTYKLTVTYDGYSEELSLNVGASTIDSQVRRYNYGNKVNISARSAASLEEFISFITSCESSETALFKGTFLFDDLGNNRARFGDIINNTGSADGRFVSNGMAFVVYSNDAVKAVNCGKVVAVDKTAYGGITVVVDHGLGLRSVYYCLKTATVSVGDILLTGETVGKGSASSGYSDGLTAYTELWVNNIPVSYFPLLSSAIVLEKPV